MFPEGVGGLLAGPQRCGEVVRGADCPEVFRQGVEAWPKGSEREDACSRRRRGFRPQTAPETPRGAHLLPPLLPAAARALLQDVALVFALVLPLPLPAPPGRRLRGRHGSKRPSRRPPSDPPRPPLPARPGPAHRSAAGRGAAAASIPHPSCGNRAAQARGRGVDLARRSGAASSGGRSSGASSREPSPRGDRRRPRLSAPRAPLRPSPQPGYARDTKPCPVHGPTHDLGPASEEPPCSCLGPTYPRPRPRPWSSAPLSPAQRSPAP